MRHLDTNIVIAYLNGNEIAALRLKEYLPDVAISALVLAELLYGARISARAVENLEKLNQLQQIIEIADFDRSSADSYSRIRARLRQKGRLLARWIPSLPLLLWQITQLLLLTIQNIFKVSKDCSSKTG